MGIEQKRKIAMPKLIKKSIFVFKNYGLKTFIAKTLKYPINKINLWKIKLANESAQKNKEKIIEELKNFQSQKIEEVFNFVWNFYGGLIRPIFLSVEPSSTIAISFSCPTGSIATLTRPTISRQFFFVITGDYYGKFHKLLFTIEMLRC